MKLVRPSGIEDPPLRVLAKARHGYQLFPPIEADDKDDDDDVTTPTR